MKVLLIFRSRQKGGTSIEGLFQAFLQDGHQDIQFVKWEYDPERSFLKNLKALRNQEVDIWHITGDINYMAIGLWGKKTVLTIHDIGNYKVLKGWKKWMYGKLWIQWPIRWSKRVTIVSHYTNHEILGFFSIKHQDKIQVVHNAVNPLYTGTEKLFNPECPALLQVGTAVHKNLETLIKAISGLNCKLYIIGALSDLQRTMLRSSQIQFENHENVSEEELKHFYSLADIVVFPSLHEGFGLPVLEAQAMGRPLITTRMTSIPEVAGFGAHFLDNPLNPDELKNAILRIIQDADYRKGLIETGYKNASQFTWPKMKEAYFELYKNLVSA